MYLTSSVFAENEKIPEKYTCDGDNINPPLSLVDVDGGAKSVALIVDDPDAPNGTWDHWIIWNISPETEEINEDSTPQNAVVGKNSFGKNDYGGPCPPSGTHRYFFRLYSLDTTIDLPKNSDKAALEQAMENHILQKAQLIGTFR
ncbi:MAG TPA: YbhB/YbcL family Raf kinase inhibitor-like protein [bacterium]|nr:YbhB/YbcL family Raf kinase inhibitor-like protein [bacterium]